MKAVGEQVNWVSTAVESTGEQREPWRILCRSPRTEEVGTLLAWVSLSQDKLDGDRGTGYRLAWRTRVHALQTSTAIK